MFKGYRYLIISLFVFLACSREDDKFTPEIETSIPKVDTSVSTEDIEGTWFVYAGEFMDNLVETTPNFSECGFDYIVFSDSGVYQEFLYSNSDCIQTINLANWIVEKGIIKLSSTTGDKIEFPILEYKPEQLVLNFKFDFDDDGNKEIFKAYLRPYDPISNNHVANSFERDSNETTLLKFNWEQETDSEYFRSYEIYRSQEGPCSKEDAILLTEINDISNTTFVDYSPPSTQNNLCYFLRVYSIEGLVGESEMLTENPSELTMPSTFRLNNASVDGENILLEWSEYNIPYFSHFEIVYANSDGSNLLFHEEDSIVLIDSLDKTSYLDTDPPYLENPFYAIYAYNIFGTKTVSNYEQITFRRNGLIGPIYLEHIEIDDDDPAVYLHGSSQIPDWASYDINAVLRLNYGEGVLESTTRDEVYVAGEFPFRKPINFPEGKELVINGRTNLHFLDPTSLTENFSFSSFYLHEQFDLFGIVDFTYTKNGFLVVIDMDSIFVFQRNGQELILLDKQIHYETHHGDNFYRMVQVNDNEIIVGHKNDGESILYAIDNSGLLQNRRVVSLSFSSDYIAKYKNTSFYSASSNSLINYGQRTLYSTLSFQAEAQMPKELFALGMDKDAKYIFASTNDPDWYGSDIQTKLLKREVLLFDTATSQTKSIKTKGYPIWVFENNLGEIFSISIPENQKITQFDIFVERINFP